MKKLEKYTGEKTYMYPNAVLATPERVLADFPAAVAFPHVIETDDNGEVLFAIMNLSAMRSQYGIDASLTEEEAIQELENILNTPEKIVVEEDTATTALENIAAQLEFQNMMALDDVTTTETV